MNKYCTSCSEGHVFFCIKEEMFCWSTKLGMNVHVFMGNSALTVPPICEPALYELKHTKKLFLIDDKA